MVIIVCARARVGRAEARRALRFSSTAPTAAPGASTAATASELSLQHRDSAQLGGDGHHQHGHLINTTAVGDSAQPHEPASARPTRARTDTIITMHDWEMHTDPSADGAPGGGLSRGISGGRDLAGGEIPMRGAFPNNR